MDSKIKTFEDACAAEGINPAALPDVSTLDPEFQERVTKGYKLDVIIKALNNEGQDEKWEADYANRSQWKYEPRFYFSPGSGWSYGDYADWYSYSCVGARRVFRSYEVMKYAVTQFLDYYIAIL